VQPAIDAAMLGRSYERYADHAVSAARQVVYVATAKPEAPWPDLNTRVPRRAVRGDDVRIEVEHVASPWPI
jgi:hypothetical protein